MKSVCIACQSDKNLTALFYSSGSHSHDSFCCRACLPRLYADAQLDGVKLYRPAFDSGGEVWCLCAVEHDDPRRKSRAFDLLYKPWEPPQPWRNPQPWRDQ